MESEAEMMGERQVGPVLLVRWTAICFAVGHGRTDSFSASGAL